MRSHHDLDVWRKSIDIVTTIYEITKSFPNSEQYGLTNQIRRSAVSIPSNIAEGAGRNSLKEFIYFLSVTLGSIAELETQLIIANNLNFIKDKTLNDVLEELISIRKMTLGLKKSIDKKI